METYTKTETKTFIVPEYPPLREGERVMPPNVVKVETITVTTYKKEDKDNG